MKSAIAMSEKTYRKLNHSALNHLLDHADEHVYENAKFGHEDGYGTEVEKALSYATKNKGDVAFGLINHNGVLIPHTFVVKDGVAYETSDPHSCHLPRIGLKMNLSTYRDKVGQLSSPWVFNVPGVDVKDFTP